MATPFIGLQKHATGMIITDRHEANMSAHQTVYHDVSINSGHIEHAKSIVDAFQNTLHGYKGLVLLSWLMGAHLKAKFGHYPHLIVRSNSAGLTTLLEDAKDLMPLRIIDSETLRLDEKVAASISNTSFPVVWENVTSINARQRDNALNRLRQCYGTEYISIGRWQHKYRICAPVLIDDGALNLPNKLPFQALCLDLQKTDKGEKLPLTTLNQWPMYTWLQFLCTQTKYLPDMHLRHMQQAQQKTDFYLQPHQAENYALVACAWQLICEFVDIDSHSLVAQGVYSAIAQTIIGVKGQEVFNG